MKIFKLLILFFTIFLFVGCDTKDEKVKVSEDKNTNLLKTWYKDENLNKDSNESFDLLSRWYSDEMIKKGEVIYTNNCISCHGEKGKGVILPWNEKMDNGLYPPPPLNDDAHAWHHPLKALRYTINEGGKPYGGVMPPFKDKLSDEDIENVIAYIQSLWSDPYYKEWLKRGGLKK